MPSSLLRRRHVVIGVGRIGDLHPRAHVLAAFPDRKITVTGV
jgi:hypothetical protein